MNDSSSSVTPSGGEGYAIQHRRHLAASPSAPSPPILAPPAANGLARPGWDKETFSSILAAAEAADGRSRYLSARPGAYAAAASAGEVVDISLNRVAERHRPSLSALAPHGALGRKASDAASERRLRTGDGARDALQGHDDPAWGATAEPPLDAEAWWVRGERARLRAALLRRDALRDGTVSAAEFVSALSEPNYQPDRAASAGFAPGWD